MLDVKYCEIFLRSGETLYSEMEDEDAIRLTTKYREQAPGIHEFKDEEGAFLLRMTDVICICCNHVKIRRTVGFYMTDTP